MNDQYPLKDALQRILQVKAAYEADFLQRPGVTGVDVGFKYVNGKRTSDVAVRVFVKEKKAVPDCPKAPAVGLHYRH
jgi:hypothetical protein